MASEYYRPCPELDAVNSLFDRYWEAKEYGACFAGLLPLAQQGYPLAECQVGYFYSEGLGVPKDMEQALYWTRRAAEHGDWDAQYNLGEYCESGTGVPKDLEQARHWYYQAALQNHGLALEKCRQLGISLKEGDPAANG